MNHDLPLEVQKLIGKKKEHFYEVNTRDIKHFAQAIGDDNPLYLDEQYAKNTQYGSIIAPPLFCQIYTFEDVPFEDLTKDGSPTELDIPIDATRTVGGASQYEFHQHVRPGDTIRAVTELKAVNKKQGRSGILYFIIVETSFYNQLEDLVAREEATYVKR